MNVSDTPRFHLPFEHGAWWTFETCLAAGMVQAWGRSVPLLPLVALALGMQALFLASDWLTAIAQSVILDRRRGSTHIDSPVGVALGVGGAVLVVGGLAVTPLDLRAGLAGALGVWSLFAAGVLWLRVTLPPRSSRLLISSAVLLTGPTLVLGGLALGGYGSRALFYWSLWAWFFAAGVNYVQVWMRGNTLPRWRIWTASLPYLVEAGALAVVSRWVGTVVLLLLSARVIWRLRLRLSELSHPDGNAHLPTSPHEIRQLGYEQVAWSLALTCIWVWRHWP